MYKGAFEMSSTDFDDEHSAGHERWIISYADLVTLLFAFFTVMYSISVVNISKYKLVSESMSLAISGKERPKTYPGLAEQTIDPTVPQLDFLNDIPFSIQPSLGAYETREILFSKINFLSHQQSHLLVQIDPNGSIVNALLNKTGALRQDVMPIVSGVSKHLAASRQGIDELQVSLKAIFEREDAQLTALAKDLSIAKESLIDKESRLSIMQTNLNDIASENARLINIVNQSNQQVEELRSVKTALLNGYQERSTILNRLQKILSTEGVSVEIDLKNGILRLPESLLFSSAKADFSRNGKKAIEVLSLNLLKVLPCYSSAEQASAESSACADPASNFHLESVLIEGHTDILPISNDQYKDNWDLSYRRAKNTFLEIIKSQPKIEALNNSNQQPLLSFSSYAGRRPIANNKTEAGRRQNRRIDLRFIMTPIQLQSDDEMSDFKIK